MPTSFKRNIALLFLAVILAVPSAFPQCVSLTAAGSPYNQDFNTLASTGTSSTTPAGWFFLETGTNANTTYTAGTGSSNTGDTYSFGAAASTERALGGLQSGSLVPTVGACFTNNTGAAITSLAIAYTGEQWRLGTAARTDRIDFQYSSNATSLSTGTWVDENTLDFTSPFTSTLGALDGNAAANRTALSSTVSGLNIANGATFWIRWNSFDASGADDGLGVDDFALTPNPSGPSLPNLSINDVTQAEGNSSTTSFVFTVSLSSPAGAGGVTFDIATQDNTATTAGNDYVASSLTGQTILSGSSTYTFTVQVNGDTTPEPNETFFVNVTNVTGANVSDGQGTGAIQNDDVSLTNIHDIQGPGATSPFVLATVTTSGIVTGLKSNGFFVQNPEPSYDANPATSEGLFVFTSSTPPAAAVLGNMVQVTGTVSEFSPSTDATSPPLTELVTPTTVLLSSGNPLPAPIPLTASFPDPAGVFDQLERVEGMRVSISSLTVVAPTQGNKSEANATSTTTGVFYGTITGIPRPFREPGIQAPDAPPSGTIPPIPRFDSNPELIRVDSDAQPGSAAIDASTGAVISGIVGPLEFNSRAYSVLPDAATPPSAPVGGMTSFVAVPVPTANEFTIGAFNMERFFDTAADAGVSDVVLTAAAYNLRLTKASLAIRNVLRMPDVLAVEEIEKLTVLQDIANRVNNDAVAASQPNPGYIAFLVEGVDIGGIDVGFLVKSPRVSVTSVVQGAVGTYIDPTDGSTDILNDRPPLILNASISGTSFTVIVNHLRSLLDLVDPVSGPRVRAKRRAQAEFLANLIQARQVADPNERILVVGDFNAYQFNDGYVDIVGTVKGDPTPASQVVLASADLVNPNLTNLVDFATASERYTYSFSGSAQVIDQVLANAPMFSRFSRYAVARLDADFPEILRGDISRPERLSDHDAPVAYFTLANLPPTATDQTAIVPFDTATVIALTAGDPEAGPVTLATTAAPAKGSVNYNNAAISATYTPIAGSSGGDQFTYTITDNAAQTASATVKVLFNLNNQTNLTRSGLLFSRVTNTYNGTITIRNNTAQTLNGPFHVLLGGITPGVTLANPSGTYNGAPYVSGSVASLAPNATTSIAVRFNNPSNTAIGYTTTLLSGGF